jgi:hypothetical protein
MRRTEITFPEKNSDLYHYHSNETNAAKGHSKQPGSCEKDHERYNWLIRPETNGDQTQKRTEQNASSIHAISFSKYSRFFLFPLSNPYDDDILLSCKVTSRDIVHVPLVKSQAESLRGVALLSAIVNY